MHNPLGILKFAVFTIHLFILFNLFCFQIVDFTMYDPIDGYIVDLFNMFSDLTGGPAYSSHYCGI